MFIRVCIATVAAILVVTASSSEAIAKPKAKTAALQPSKAKSGEARAGKAPAYQVKGLPFLTHLHGESGKEVECAGASCNDGRGTVVARGGTDKGRGSVDIVIREHRDTKGAGADQLLTLSQRLARRSDEVRVVSGTVGESAAIEQWTVKSTCGGPVTARVLVALADKVIEIETTARPDAKGTRSAKSAKLVRDMTAILRAIRVRRLGDQVLDPAKDKVPVEKIAEAIPAKGC